MVSRNESDCKKRSNKKKYPLQILPYTILHAITLRFRKSIHLPQETLVYPPNMYFPPTLIIVTVGPLWSHRLWKVLAAQPSTDARQQRLHCEDLLETGLSKVLKYVK